MKCTAEGQFCYLGEKEREWRIVRALSWEGSDMDSMEGWL